MFLFHGTACGSNTAPDQSDWSNWDNGVRLHWDKCLVDVILNSGVDVIESPVLREDPRAALPLGGKYALVYIMERVKVSQCRVRVVVPPARLKSNK